MTKQLLLLATAASLAAAAPVRVETFDNPRASGKMIWDHGPVVNAFCALKMGDAGATMKDWKRCFDCNPGCQACSAFDVDGGCTKTIGTCHSFTSVTCEVAAPPTVAPTVAPPAQCAARCGSEMGFTSSNGPDLYLSYDGATLTVPQHCREETCAESQAKIAALTSANADLQSRVDALEAGFKAQSDQITALLATAAPTPAPTPAPMATSCKELHARGKTTDGIYQVKLPATGQLRDVYCLQSKWGGGWTLVLRGTGDGSCRAKMINVQGMYGKVPRTDSAPSNQVDKLDNSDINALATRFWLVTVAEGERYAKGKTYKFGHSKCAFNPANIGAMRNNQHCYEYQTEWEQVGRVWKHGDSGQCGGGCAPFATNGGGNEYNGGVERGGSGNSDLLSAGLFDSAVCFDSWGKGTARGNLIWAK